MCSIILTHFDPNSTHFSAEYGTYLVHSMTILHIGKLALNLYPVLEISHLQEHCRNENLNKCLHWKPLIVRTARKHSLKFNFAKMAYNIDTKEWKCRKNKVNFPLFENCHWLMFSDYKKMPAVLLLKHNTNVHKFYKWQSPKMFKLCLSCVIWHGQNFLPNVKTSFNGTHAMHIT